MWGKKEEENKRKWEKMTVWANWEKEKEKEARDRMNEHGDEQRGSNDEGKHAGEWEKWNNAMKK
jgi:hypothetical protein